VQNKRSRAVLLWWRIANPCARLLAPLAPWWVVLETTGRKTGAKRQVPLATGPRDGDSVWLIAVHGRHTAWVLNIDADPAVRLRSGLRWRRGTASVHPLTPELYARFNRYARAGRQLLGMDPLAVRVDLSN
jgi:deazaflavin-dependent oxidoreductase (nitroreductase family)